MNLKQWLEEEKGRSAALASHFGIQPSAVSQWKSNGVPLAHMKAVRDFTRGKVSLEEMVPGVSQPTRRPAKAGA
jgi:DNA-binding transcriptional regulator YdaS (Cro superfamily)